MNRRTFLTSSASVAFLNATPSFASVPAVAIHPPNESFLQSLPELMELATLPGLAMAVVQPGQPLWQYNLGQSNAQAGTRITPTSLFPGCSLGKPIFATLALRLAQDEVL